MVKVVGRDQRATRRVTCRKCASILEYTQNDVIKTKINHDYLGDSDTVSAVQCPTCSHNQPVS